MPKTTRDTLARTAWVLFIVATLLISASGGGILGPILCLHADGSAAVESGDEGCCGGEAGDAPRADASTSFEAAGRCPGCNDFVLDVAGDRTIARGKSVHAGISAARVSTGAPDPDSVGTTAATLVPGGHASPPPGALPLRI